MSKKQISQVIIFVVDLVLVSAMFYGSYLVQKSLYTHSLEKRVEELENEINILNEKMKEVENERTKE